MEKKESQLPKYEPNTFQKNKIPKELWGDLARIVYEYGYLCYHDDDGCHYVLRQIVDKLHDYKIVKDQENNASQEKIKIVRGEKNE